MICAWLSALTLPSAFPQSRWSWTFLALHSAWNDILLVYKVRVHWGVYTAWPLDGSCARHKISMRSGDIIKQVECFFRHVWYRDLSVWFPVGSKQHVGPTPSKHGLMVDLLSFDRPVPSDKLGNFIANLSWNASFTYIALSRTGHEIPTFTLLFYSITPPWRASPCA